MKKSRIIFYWAILLGSALVLGGVAFGLLLKERSRIDEIAQESVTAKGQTIADNIDLIVDDVKTGLMASLSAFPENGLEAELPDWGGSNGLVSRVILWSPDKGLIIPSPQTPEGRRVTVQCFDETRQNWSLEQRAADNRIVQQEIAFINDIPLEKGNYFNAKAQRKQIRAQAEDAYWRNVGNNKLQQIAPPESIQSNINWQTDGANDAILAEDVVTLQSADPIQTQRQVGVVIRQSVAMQGAPADDPAEIEQIDQAPQLLQTNGIPSNRFQSDRVESENAPIVTNQPVSQAQRVEASNAPFPNAPPIANNGKVFEVISANESTATNDLSAATGLENSGHLNNPGGLTIADFQQAFPEPEPTFAPEIEWVFRDTGAGYAWLGWYRIGPFANIRGVEIDMAAMVASFASAFPENLDQGETYILRDDSGKVIHTACILESMSSLPPLDFATTPADAILAVGEELPGWTVAVYRGSFGSSNKGYLFVASALVIVLLTALAGGGTMLFAQAQRDSLDAARKTTFVSNVSHELKTPLTTIRMYAEMLGDGRVRNEDKQKRYLHTIIDESQRLGRLVNNVLDFSRIEQGRKKYSPVRMNLAESVEHFLEAQSARLEEAHIELEKSITTPGGPVEIDRDALEQVLLNLLDNAIKYGAEDNRIHVSVGEENGSATVEIRDNGPGIPAQHQERIFEKFHRIDDSLTADKPGSGLGLAIARRMMRDNGGDLVYRPAQPSGSRFIAYLPKVTNGASPED